MADVRDALLRLAQLGAVGVDRVNGDDAAAARGEAEAEGAAALVRGALGVLRGKEGNSNQQLR